MKKHLNVLIFVFALSFVSHSALANYGARLGLTSSKLSIGNDLGSVDTDSSTKFLIGVFAEFNLIPVVVIEGAANWFNLSPTTNFLTIPVTLKAKVDAGPVRPYILAGPEVDIKLKDDTSAAKTVSFAFDIGGGAEFSVAPKFAILAEIRYVMGFTKLADGVVAALPADAKMKSWQFLTGVSFGM